MNTKRRRVPSEERRRQILGAAVKVFGRSNFKRARVSDIAEEVGVTEAAIYKHFPTKKTIYVELLDHLHGRVLTFWEKAAASALEGDPIDTLHAMGLAYYRRIAKHPDELRVQFQAISEVGDRDISQRLRKHHRQYRDFVAALIQRGIAEGSVRADVDPQTIGYLFDGAGVFMNMMKILGDRALTERQYEMMAEQLLEPLRK
ncbi:MAG: TetR/AcrR family transcriptional regulator [bacterium]|nr:TetR/AcrR family transcriptional regulator [bacterium]